MTYIITATCVRCGVCEPICPVDAIDSANEGEPYHIDPETCVDCGECDESCPVDAIYRKM